MKQVSLITLVLLAVLSASSLFPAVAAVQLPAGSYRCWSYNVGGGAGSCRGVSPIILNTDGTYQISSERGTYSVSGDRIVLSESKIRGTGRLQNGNQIMFEYTYQGLHHTVTYLCSECSASSPPAAPVRQTPPAGAVALDINIRFQPSYGSTDWINTAALIPENDSSLYASTGRLPRGGYERLAVSDGGQLVRVSFRGVMQDVAYALFVGSGFERRFVGKVELHGVVESTELTIDALPDAALAPPGPAENRATYQPGTPPINSDNAYSPNAANLPLGTVSGSRQSDLPRLSGAPAIPNSAGAGGKPSLEGIGRAMEGVVKIMDAISHLNGTEGNGGAGESMNHPANSNNQGQSPYSGSNPYVSTSPYSSSSGGQSYHGSSPYAGSGNGPGPYGSAPSTSPGVSPGAYGPYGSTPNSGSTSNQGAYGSQAPYQGSAGNQGFSEGGQGSPDPSAAPCNPLIPKYSQPGCRE